MKAYNLAMLLIFINAGIAIVFSTGTFGATFGTHQNSWLSLSFLYTNPLLVTVFSVALVSASVYLSIISKESPSGISISTFTAIFWISMTTSLNTLHEISLVIEGTEIFFTILLLSGTLIFVMTLVQMPTGGQKTYE